MDELQDVLDGGELRPGGGGGLPGEESQGGHLAVGLLTRHGSCLLLLLSLLTDLSGEAGDDVGGRTGGSSQEHFLTGGKVLVSRERVMVMLWCTHAGRFLCQTP